MSDVELAPGTKVDSAGLPIPRGAESDYAIGEDGSIVFTGKTLPSYAPPPPPAEGGVRAVPDPDSTELQITDDEPLDETAAPHGQAAAAAPKASVKKAAPAKATSAKKKPVRKGR